MAGLFGFFKRMHTIISPPSAPKENEVLRFGILGAANIAPQALIVPARSHPEVIVAAVAARDPKKAEAFAKKHDIPIVHKTYDDLIADPTLDCIYNPLPNGLHYEWTLKALKAGKHVLLEKPSVSNATEAKSLFRHPILSKPNAPVLLEAFHYRFHPAWSYFLSLFDPEAIEHVEVNNRLLASIFSLDDIRFNYSLSGGTLMDLGTYAVSSVRGVFESEPTSVTSASYRPMPEGYDKQCDEAIFASYTFGSATAKLSADLQSRGGYWLPFLTRNWPGMGLPRLTLRLKPHEEQIEEGVWEVVTKELVFHNYMVPYLYHRIDITTTTSVKSIHDGRIFRSKKETEYKKAYTWPKGQEGKKGEDWWATYRYQLEAFVDKVKGRKGSGVWVDGEESIKQMEMIDRTYEKAGLPLRPTSKALET